VNEVKIKIITCLSSVIFLLSSNLNANNTELTVEELRIAKAKQKMPQVSARFNVLLAEFKAELKKAQSFVKLDKLVSESGLLLWQQAIRKYSENNDFDDRPLYWGRLQMMAEIKQSDFFAQLSSTQQQQLLWKAELVTRGQSDIAFDKNTTYKVLLTGFDPFFLDRNLDQSNPSGVVATAFDNKVITFDGATLEIETVIVPVRYADFDQGMIEELLTPYMRDKKVDMVVTVSMGREGFDLERFPGLRRSANAPDNLNVFTGASSEKPLIPLLDGKRLKGPEFNLFSLPVEEMKTADGDFAITDNHKVTTTEKTFRPATIDELSGKISVQGSGGGYLSNEISYRSLLLRDQHNPKLPVGHIHTPRFKGFKPQKIEKIVEQVEQMIKMSMTTF